MCTGNDRTIVIPSGTLDGNVTNVVVIPNQLECSNQSLIVRAAAANRSLPIHGSPGGAMQRPYRYASSLDGSPARVPEPDHYERDFGVPPANSSFQSYVDDDYYFDMYDDSLDRFVGGSSGDLSGSALQAILGGEHNRISRAGGSPGGCACGGQEASAAADQSAQAAAATSHYTPFSVPHATYSGIYGDPGDYVPPEPACGPCFPGLGGNPELCPPTCPVQRGVPFGGPNVRDNSGIPFGDLNVTGGSVPALEEEPAPVDLYMSPPAANQTGPAPRRPRTQLPARGGARARTPPRKPRSLLPTRIPRLNQAKVMPPQPAPAPCLDRTRTILNRTRPVINPMMDLNQTRGVPQPGLNRTLPVIGGGLDGTYPVMRPDLNQTYGIPQPAPNLNQTCGVEQPECNRTRPIIGADLDQSRPDLNRTLPVIRPDMNRTYPMQQPAMDLNRTRPVYGRPHPNRDFNVTGTVGYPGFDRTRPIIGGDLSGRYPDRPSYRDADEIDRTNSQVYINVSFGSPQASSTPNSSPQAGRRPCRPCTDPNDSF